MTDPVGGRLHEERSRYSSRMRARCGLVVTLAVALILTGCASHSVASKPPADGGHFGTVDALKKAYVAAGGSCPDWKKTEQVKAAAESGSCSEDTLLAIYTSTSDRDQTVNNVKAIGALVGGASQLVGKNWTINGPDASKVEKKMGGTLVVTKGN
jgi:hypothetical protein